ncbi:unnamed protein product [Pseudo-nitzschia multistriata]|uniref:DoxX family protein n=1 Tax=Pseudo-nitzschia multistriata TaxID=183589 RepID=A0A448ZEL3_9STRA|nr:unnamed protein product [Pseudo-nitzschia multistriata]
MKLSLCLILTSVASTLPSSTAFSASKLQARAANHRALKTSRIPSSSSLDAFRFGSASAVEELSVESSGDDRINDLLDPLTDVFVATLRVGTCALMIHHGIDKVQNVEGFSANVVAKFFGFLPGDPAFWTLSAAATQIGGSVLLALGVLARPVALSMCATMATAVAFHLLNTGGEGFPLAVVPQHSYNYELAAMYVGVLAYFSVAGAGAYSVDEQILGGELNLYRSLLPGKETIGSEGIANSASKKKANKNSLEDAYVKNSKEFKLPWSK